MKDLDESLDAIAAGDPDAFGVWVAGAEHAIRGSLASFAATVDAEVVVQETLLRMWQVAPRVERDGRPNALLRLALRTARNLAIDHTRRSGRRAPEVDLDAVTEAALAAEDDAVDPLLRDAITRCREDLPGRPAAALRARLDEGGATHDRDLAERLGMKLNTFLKNVGRARALLVECLRRRGIDVDAHLERGAQNG
ncbi:MAG: sigma factor [Planctomycetota bacterium]